MKSHKSTHLAYIEEKGKFVVDCSHAIFSTEEIETLEKFGHWFDALASGVLEPFTELQERFILVAKSELPPFSPEEKAWYRYLGRKKIEKKHGDSLNIRYHLSDNSFYSRDMVEPLRKTMFGVITSSHNG